MYNNFPKCIIEGDTFKLGKVAYHKDLATNVENVKGGAMFQFDHANKKVFISQSSYQFGPICMDDLKKAVNKGNVPKKIKDYQFYLKRGFEYELV
jgi:hypothetical protein